MNDFEPNPAVAEPQDIVEGLRLPVRGWVVLAGLAAISLFVGAVAILYVQWVRNEDPNANITLQGDAQLDEAIVTVTALGGTGLEPVIAKFKEGKNHRLRFHLPPGTYNVVVRDSAHRLLFPDTDDQEILLNAMEPRYIRLKLNPSATMPANSQPAFSLPPKRIPATRNIR